MKQKVFLFITVDIETPGQRAKTVFELLKSHKKEELFETYFTGEYAVPFIIRECGKYGFKTVLFINIYEERLWGEKLMKEFLKQCVKVPWVELGLHTHPIWYFPNESHMMWDYPKSVQSEIVRTGKNLLEAWSGKKVLSHRAGIYAANGYTLDALEENGIIFDSSYFPYHSRIDFPSKKIEMLKLKGIWELPVTYFFKFKRIFKIPFFPRRLSGICKIDPNWIDFNEFRWFITETTSKGPIFITLFLHNYSFLKNEKHLYTNKPCETTIQLFHDMLDFLLSKTELVSLGFEELLSMISNGEQLPAFSPPVLEN